MVKIRLSRRGRHKRPFYRIVVADERFPRDGRYLEVVGTFDPLLATGGTTLKDDRVRLWLGRGAQATPTVKRLLLKAGVK
ncbi:MAG: 30S ribosomal protein S16 [Nitrospirota bacterium]